MSDLEEKKIQLTTELKKKQDEIKRLEKEAIHLAKDQEKLVYTPEKRELSEFIREWIIVFNNGSVNTSKSLDTEGFSYQYHEWMGTVKITVKSKEGLTKKKFFIDWFIPELEIEIKRDFQNGRGLKYLSGSSVAKDYNWIIEHIKEWEAKEDSYGYRILPVMKIKTYTDIEYSKNEWIEVKDTKIIHYLTILRDDLKNHLDMKIVELRKNGVENNK